MNATTNEVTDKTAPEAPTKLRAPKITFQVKREGKHSALYVEDQLLTVTVHRKGATTLEALLRNCVKYSGRKLFRTALQDALTAPATPDGEDAKEAAKDETH